MEEKKKKRKKNRVPYGNAKLIFDTYIFIEEKEKHFARFLCFVIQIKYLSKTEQGFFPGL
jgi:hypothetical protein